MRPSAADVEQMTLPLMSISMGVQRAWRGRSEANILVLLQTVAASENVRPSDLATTIGVHQSSVARQLRTLEDDGYVTLTADPDDRRSCFVTLTDEGTAEYHRLMKVGLDRFADFVQDWDAKDVKTLGRLLGRLNEAMAEAKRRQQPTGGRRWQQR